MRNFLDGVQIHGYANAFNTMHLCFRSLARPAPTSPIGLVFELQGIGSRPFDREGLDYGPKRAIWIKDPLAILADGAERGMVVRAARSSNWCPGRHPEDLRCCGLEAGQHVVLPGLINTHHHFYQTLTRAVPAAMDRELFPWLQALYPVWARLTPETLELGVTVAMSELLLSGCTTTTDHHYVFPAGLEDAVDIEVAAAKRLGMRALLTRGSMNCRSATAAYLQTAWCRTKTRSLPTANAWSADTISAARTPWCRSRWRHVRRSR